jgi:hypothetical protein
MRRIRLYSRGMTTFLQATSKRQHGVSLVGLLMIVVVLGALTATAVVGVSSLTSSNNTVVTGYSGPSATGSSGSAGQKSREVGKHLVFRDQQRSVSGQVGRPDRFEPSALQAAPEGGHQPREPSRARRARLEADHDGRRLNRTDLHLRDVTLRLAAAILCNP